MRNILLSQYLKKFEQLCRSLIEIELKSSGLFSNSFGFQHYQVSLQNSFSNLRFTNINSTISTTNCYIGFWLQCTHYFDCTATINLFLAFTNCSHCAENAISIFKTDMKHLVHQWSWMFPFQFFFPPYLYFFLWSRYIQLENTLDESKIEKQPFKAKLQSTVFFFHFFVTIVKFSKHFRNRAGYIYRTWLWRKHLSCSKTSFFLHIFPYQKRKNSICLECNFKEPSGPRK